MADLNLQLLDTEQNFILISDDTETEFEYGLFAESIANTDYDNMYQMLAEFLQSNPILKLAMDLQNSNKEELNTGTLNPNIINLIIKELYSPLFDLLAKEFLNDRQTRIVTLLLMADIKSRLMEAKINLNNPEHYIPVIFSDRQLHQHIINILCQENFAYKSPLQEKINQIHISSSIIITEQGQPYQSYSLTDIFDYLILDLKKYLLGTKKVKKCACCHKLFLPQYRSSEKYCMFNHVDKNRSCREYMKRTNSTEFQKERDRARGYQSNRVHNESTLKQYDSKFLNDTYENWSKECTEKYNEFNSQNNLEAFQNWIKETKFTAKRLERLHQLSMKNSHKKKKSN